MIFKRFSIANIFRNGVCRNATQNVGFPEITIVRKITQADLNQFSSLCGDSNPIHSESLPEEERYVHGAFLNSIISGIIGSKVPGPGSIVISQKFKFPRRCKVNQEIELNVKLIEDRKIMKVIYHIKQDNNIVFQGDANLIKSSLSKK